MIIPLQFASLYDGQEQEILSRIAQATATLTRLKPVWNDQSISVSSKIQLICSLVTTIFLYVCESWTFTAELQRRIQATEMRCYRKILSISYKEHVINKEVHAKIQQAIRPHEDLLTIVRRPTLSCYALQKMSNVYTALHDTSAGVACIQATQLIHLLTCFR